LLLPFVAEHLDGFLAMGVSAAVRVVGFMEQWFTALPRDQVTKNLNACTALLITSLDYRRVYAKAVRLPCSDRCVCCTASANVFFAWSEISLDKSRRLTPQRCPSRSPCA
jgi:hypothetical protein